MDDEKGSYVVDRAVVESFTVLSYNVMLECNNKTEGERMYCKGSVGHLRFHLSSGRSLHWLRVLGFWVGDPNFQVVDGLRG